MCSTVWIFAAGGFLINILLKNTIDVRLTHTAVQFITKQSTYHALLKSDDLFNKLLGNQFISLKFYSVVNKTIFQLEKHNYLSICVLHIYMFIT